MSRIGRGLRNSFVGGLVIVAPLLITLFIFKFAYDWAVGLINPIVRGTGLVQLTGNIALVAQVLAIAAILVAITLVGVLAQYSVGRRTFGEFGRAVNFIPFFRTVYGSIRQVATAVVERSSDYESVVYVEYREGLYSIGFITGESPASVEEVAGQEVQNVYMPSAPNPTNGRLQLVPVDRMYESELSVREAIRLLMTTGTTIEDGEDHPMESLGVPPLEEEEGGRVGG